MAIQSPVEQIKERTPIVDLVGQRVKLVKSGRNLKGLCPFHSEKTPSFYVFPDRDNYHCFGCGQSGDAFTFVMRTENVEFGEALRILAGRAGVELPERGQRKVEEERYARLYEATAAAARYFQAMLFAADGAPALRYLEERGLERGTIEAFQLGWAPESWDALLKHLGEQGFQPDELLEVGLVVARESGGHYDRFRGRVIFPIRDPGGRVIGFGGRAMGDQQPKYLNSADSPLFVKGSVLYARDAARAAVKREGLAIVVEGYMDVIAAHQAGIAHAVASMGTALTEEHLLAMKRLAPRAVLALDADAAGDAAALRTLEVIRATYGRIATPVADRRGLVRLRYDQELDVRVARLPVGKDPDDVIRASPGEFLRLIAEALPIVEVLIDAELARAGADVHARALAADNVLDFLKDMPNPVIADQYTRMLAERATTDYEALRSRLGELRRRERRRAPSRAVQAVRADQPPEPRLRDWLTFEEFLLRLILRHPEQAQPELADLSPDDLYRADARAILEAVLALFSTEGAVDAERVIAHVDGPLADHARWIVEWGADTPEPVEVEARQQIALCLLHLRMLNHRREVALIAAHRRELDREGEREEWPRQRARVGELSSEIRALERQLRGRPGGALARDWTGFFRAETRLGIMRALPPERSTAAAEAAAAGT